MAISTVYAFLLAGRKQYSVSVLAGFLRQVYLSGKTVELLSFLFWEVQHRLRVQPPSKYIQFTDTPPYTLSESGELMLALPTNPELLNNSQQHDLTIKSVGFDWKYCLVTSTGERWGCSMTKDKYLYYQADEQAPVVFCYEFSDLVKSLFMSRKGILFVASGGKLYRSDSGIRSFAEVLSFSSSISWFLFNNGMTELPNGELLIGEYGSIWKQNSWQCLAYMYHSTDGGLTWNCLDGLAQRGVNKHVHIIKYSARLQAVILTDGDNQKKAWINTSLSQFNKLAKSETDGWQMLNRWHVQKGGYTSMAEGATQTLLGTDYMGGTNFLVKTSDGRQFTSSIVPDPYRRCPIMNLVTRKTRSGSEIWASLYASFAGSRCLIMYTRDEGQTWTKFLDYDGTRYAAHLITSPQGETDFIQLSITSYLGEHTVYTISDAIMPIDVETPAYAEPQTF